MINSTSGMLLAYGGKRDFLDREENETARRKGTDAEKEIDKGSKKPETKRWAERGSDGDRERKRAKDSKREKRHIKRDRGRAARTCCDQDGSAASQPLLTSRTRAPAPSPMTKPHRASSKGRDASSGASSNPSANALALFREK